MLRNTLHYFNRFQPLNLNNLLQSYNFIVFFEYGLEQKKTFFCLKLKGCCNCFSFYVIYNLKQNIFILYDVLRQIYSNLSCKTLFLWFNNTQYIQRPMGNNNKNLIQI